MKHFSKAKKPRAMPAVIKNSLQVSENFYPFSIAETIRIPDYIGLNFRKLNIISIFMMAQIILCLSTVASAQSPIVGYANVIDGDTLEVSGIRIRLHGIDAPESRQKCMRLDGTYWHCGQQAALALSDRIGPTVIRCQPRDRDRYGRIIAICFKGTEDLDRWMVAAGWAVAFRKYSLDYVDEEENAKRGRHGMWSGNFEMPWDWRAKGFQK